MFTVNIYLRLALIAGCIAIGVVLTMMYGFWYAFPLYLVAFILLAGYLLFGTVQSASKIMQTQDLEGARKRLNMTIFPKLLFGPGRSAYYMLKGSLAMQGKDYNEAKELFKESENSKYTTDNEKAMIYLQQANLAAVKNNYKEAAMFVKKTDELKITEPMIRDQVKQFKQALGKSGQMTMTNRIAAANRGGSKTTSTKDALSQDMVIPGLCKIILLKTQFLNKTVALLCILAAALNSYAQEIHIDSITFTGLKRTKSYILKRELTFKAGDTILLKEIQALFATNESRLLNTGLFVEAKINLLALDLKKKKAHIQIRLKEGLFIYPAPLFEFLDNDFNKWWKNYDRSLKTLSYGIFLKHINLTGNSDELTVYAQAGFTKKISIDYDFPFLNKANTIGLGLTTFYSANREVAYTTEGNYLKFTRNLDKDLIRRSKVGTRMVYRPKLFIKHYFLANWYKFDATDSLTQYFNPDFFNGRDKIDFLELEYAVTYDTRDVVPYALKGDRLLGYLSKSGLSKENNINIFYIGAQAAHYTPLSDYWSLENVIGGRFNLDRGKVPYYFNKALGYDDLYLRGYEYYVIDGQDYAFIKNSIRFMFFEKNFQLGKYMILKAYRKMPVKAYLTANVDAGLVHDSYYAALNPFANRSLYGYGLGLDITFYYNKLLRFEVSRNHTGQTGFYVHFDAGL